MRLCAIALLVSVPAFAAEYYAQNTDTMDNSPPSATSNTIENGSANPVTNNANGRLSGNKDMPPLRRTASHLGGSHNTDSKEKSDIGTPAPKEDER